MRLLAQLLAREDARAADPVAARSRPEEDDGVPGRAGAGAGDAVGGDEADAHRVHQAVVAVGDVEDRVAADGRDADAIAVVADALHRALEMPVGLAEAEPVQQRDGPRAHGDDVADDPADAGGRALERLDRGRVVVALDLEGDRLALAEVDHAGVLARPLQHARARGRQPAQEQGRMLVGAVLGPKEREDGELEVVRVSAQELADPLQLPISESERSMKGLFDDLRQREGSLVAGGDAEEPGRGKRFGASHV